MTVFIFQKIQIVSVSNKFLFFSICSFQSRDSMSFKSPARVHKQVVAKWTEKLDKRSSHKEK